MEIKFEKIKGNSTQFYVISFVLALLVLGGIVSTYLMYERGIYLSGMTNRIPWGLQIILAVYYIGLSAGSLVTSSLYGVFGKIEYKPFARIAAYLAMLLLIGALLSIFTDQGRIDRVLIQPFAHFNPLSMFSINPFLYISYVLLCMIYLWAMLVEKEKMVKVMALVVVLWAIGLHSGTGAIFGYVPRELYGSPLSPPSFVAAALSSGTALMILVILALFKLTKRYLDNRLIMWIGHLLAVFILVVLYFLFIENSYRIYQHESREAARFFLFNGISSILFWIGLIIIGSIIPAVILFRKKTGRSIPWIVFSAILVVIGVLCERYLIVIPGLTYPPDMLPGWEITQSPIAEGIVRYSISFPEILQALGVVGFIGLLFMWGMKFMKLVPIEARMIETSAAEAK